MYDAHGHAVCILLVVLCLVLNFLLLPYMIEKYGKGTHFFYKGKHYVKVRVYAVGTLPRRTFPKVHVTYISSNT